MTDREKEVEEARIAEYIEREIEAHTFSIFDIYKESNVGDFCRALSRLFLRFCLYPMQDFYDHIYNLNDFTEIEGIENAGVDCWGKFLNIPRTIQYTDVNGEVAIYRLNDTEYKGAIKNKLFTYFTNGTLEDINSNLKDKLALSAYVVDNQNMTQVNYFLQEEIRLWNIALLKDYGTVPRAMGVSVEVTDIVDRFISFEGQYVEGAPSPDGYMTNFFNAIFYDERMQYNNEDITTKEEEVEPIEEGKDEPNGTEEGDNEEKKEGEVEPSTPEETEEGGDTDTDGTDEKEEEKEPGATIDEEEEKRKQEEEERQRLEEEQRLKEEEERLRKEEEERQRQEQEQEEKERAEREAEEQRQREEEERQRQEEERKKQEEDKMNEFVKRMQAHLNISQSPAPATAIMNVDSNISVIMAETEAIANMYLELKDKIDAVDIREYMTHFEGDTVTFFHHLRRALGYVLTNISRPYHRTSYTTGAVSQQGAMYTLSEDKKQKYLDNLRVIYDFLTTQFLKYITFTPTDTLKTPLDIFDLIRETAVYSDKHARFISGTRTEAQYIQKWGSLDIMKNCVDRVEAIKEWIAKNGEDAGWLSIKSYNSSPNSLSASVEFCYYATNGTYSKNNYGTAWFSEINTKLENSYTLLKVKITDDYILSEVI